MNYEQLMHDFHHSSAIKLLRADHAPFIISFLHRLFKRDERITIPLEELADRLEAAMEEAQAGNEEIFARGALDYLTEWADERHRFLRIVKSNAQDAPSVELTSDTERAIGWIEELHTQPFVGTESRLLHIMQQLQELVVGSTNDPATRLEHLRQERDRLQHEISTIEATGQVPEVYSPTQQRERFYQITEMARGLLRDFHSVEDAFRAVSMRIQEDYIQEGAPRGTLVAHWLDTEAALRASDQGQSFYAFMDHLAAHNQRTLLRTLLDTTRQLADLTAIAHEGGVLWRLPNLLLEAGERVLASNHRIADQLRRMLDDTHVTERRRLEDLIGSIKQIALRIVGGEPDRVPFLELEGAPAPYLGMERTLWQGSVSLAFPDMPKRAALVEPANLHLLNISPSWFVNEYILRAHIDDMLAVFPEVTLEEVLARYPLRQGLGEILAYCTIAASEEHHNIDPSQRAIISLGDTSQLNHARIVAMPVVRFRRNRNDQR